MFFTVEIKNVLCSHPSCMRDIFHTKNVEGTAVHLLNAVEDHV